MFATLSGPFALVSPSWYLRILKNNQDMAFGGNFTGGLIAAY